jgi:O-antigen ligase
VIVSLAAYFGGPALSRLPHTGFLRSLALISPELALSTRAGETMEWRETQWDLAAIQIKEHPIIGRGYGGLENAFEFADPSQLDQAVFDIDLATGGIHNGYIACALAFGIPAALLFVYILSSQIMGNARRAAKIHRDDPVAAEMHCFVCAHLLSFACAIYIGTDLNSPFIWFLLGLGVLTTNVKLAEKKKAKAVPPVFAQPTLARAV